MANPDISIRHGETYPYDAPDDDKNWWTATKVDWAHRAARGIIADLKDRRGIKHGFENVDEETRSEIVRSIAEIIRRCSPSGSPWEPAIDGTDA